MLVTGEGVYGPLFHMSGYIKGPGTLFGDLPPRSAFIRNSRWSHHGRGGVQVQERDVQALSELDPGGCAQAQPGSVSRTVQPSPRMESRPLQEYRGEAPEVRPEQGDDPDLRLGARDEVRRVLHVPPERDRPCTQGHGGMPPRQDRGAHPRPQVQVLQQVPLLLLRVPEWFRVQGRPPAPVQDRRRPLPQQPPPQGGGGQDMYGEARCPRALARGHRVQGPGHKEERGGPGAPAHSRGLRPRAQGPDHRHRREQGRRPRLLRQREGEYSQAPEEDGVVGEGIPHV